MAAPNFRDALVRLQELSGEWGQDMLSFIAGAMDTVGTGTMNLINGGLKSLDIGIGRALSSDGGTAHSTPDAGVSASAVGAPAVATGPIQNSIDTVVHLVQGFTQSQGVTLSHDFGTGNCGALCTELVYSGVNATGATRSAGMGASAGAP